MSLLAERVLSRTEKQPDGCWLWTGYTSGGYGRLSVGSARGLHAHRITYEAFVGPIPEGMQLDHLCRVRNCVNPDHLEPVTSRENNWRSPITNANKSACPQNHPYTTENTYRYGGRRYCRACQRARKQLRSSK